MAAMTIVVVVARAEDRAGRQRADDEAEDGQHDLEQAVAEESSATMPPKRARTTGGGQSDRASGEHAIPADGSR